MDLARTENYPFQDVSDATRTAPAQPMDAVAADPFSEHLQGDNQSSSDELDARRSIDDVPAGPLPADDRPAAADESPASDNKHAAETEQHPEEAPDTPETDEPTNGTHGVADPKVAEAEGPESPQRANQNDKQEVPKAVEPATRESRRDELLSASSGADKPVHALKPTSEAGAAELTTALDDGEVDRAGTPVDTKEPSAARTIGHPEKKPTTGNRSGGAVAHAHEQAAPETHGTRANANGPLAELPDELPADRTPSDAAVKTPVGEQVESDSPNSNGSSAHRSDSVDRPGAPLNRASDRLFTRAPAGTGSDHEVSHTDQVRLIQRVARAVQAAPQRGGVLRLRLRPPELGSLHLEVTMNKGSLTARLEAETTTARTILLDNLPQLRDRLAEQGVRVEQFDVDVSRQDPQDRPFQSNDSSQSSDTSPSPRHDSNSSESPTEPQETPTVLNDPGNGALDVIV